VDMWEPFRLSIEPWAPNCRIVYDKFHIMQHDNDAVDEVRRAEFFRKGGRMRGVVKGKRWLLLSRWVNLTAGKRQQEPALPTPAVPAYGGDQDRTRGLQESGLKGSSPRIPAERRGPHRSDRRRKFQAEDLSEKPQPPKRDR